MAPLFASTLHVAHVTAAKSVGAQIFPMVDFIQHLFANHIKYSSMLLVLVVLNIYVIFIGANVNVISIFPWHRIFPLLVCHLLDFLHLNLPNKIFVHTHNIQQEM